MLHALAARVDAHVNRGEMVNALGVIAIAVPLECFVSSAFAVHLDVTVMNLYFDGHRHRAQKSVQLVKPTFFNRGHFFHFPIPYLKPYAGM